MDILYFFRYDVDLPMLLDYEIWNSSQMLFQNTPYDFETDEEIDYKYVTTIKICNCN